MGATVNEAKEDRTERENRIPETTIDETATTTWTHRSIEPSLIWIYTRHPPRQYGLKTPSLL